MSKPENHPHILIYTDGSCHGNPGPGGYAATLRRIAADGSELKCHRVFGLEPKNTTNIRMEMTAVAKALEQLKSDEPLPIVIRPDLELIVRTTTDYLPTWLTNGWRKSDGKPVKNRDLWERIVAAGEGKPITWEWVRGHTGDPRNEQVDRLAAEQMELARLKAASLIS